MWLMMMMNNESFGDHLARWKSLLRLKSTKCNFNFIDFYEIYEIIISEPIQFCFF